MSYEYVESMDKESGAARIGPDPPPPPERGSPTRLLFLAKITIGITLCAVIVARIDWRAASSSLADTGIGLIAVMFAILIALIFVSAYKWRLLLSIHGVEYSTLRLSKYYFVALFLNNFLPTSIGGDGYRIYKTFDNGRGKASAVIAVVMERLTGFGTLVALGIGAALLLAAEVATGQTTMLAIGAAAVCAAAIPLALRARSLVPRRLLDAVPEKARRILAILTEHADDYVRQPRRSLAVILISVVFHLGLAFALFVILRYGTEQSISMLELLTVLTLTTIVAVLPISFNGLGVYEGTFIYLLAQYGVPPDASIVPMILNRGLLIALSLVGAGIYLVDTAAVFSGRAASVDVAR